MDATDPEYGTNSDATFIVDIIAPCLTTTINSIIGSVSNNLSIEDNSGSDTLTFYKDDVAYGTGSGNCGDISVTLLDSA